MEQIGLKERKSGIELLRLIAIFSVIIYHYSYNGIDFSGFSYTNLDFNHIFLQLIQTHGSLACSIFALMTGYFLVDKEIGVAYWKKYINVILVVFSYSTIFTALIYAGGGITYNLLDVIKSLLPIFWGNWYLVAYLMFYPFVPLINKMICGLNRQNYRILVFLMLIIWSVVPTLTFRRTWEFSGIDFFIVMYFLGGYIKKYIDVKDAKNHRIALCMGCSGTGLIMLSMLVLDAIGYFTKKTVFIQHAHYFRTYNSVLAVICAVGWFIWFAGLEFSNRRINGLAKNAFGVFCISLTPIVDRMFWHIISPNSDFLDSPFLWMHCIIKCVAIFVVCMLIETFRRRVFGKGYSILSEKIYMALIKKKTDLEYRKSNP